MAKRAKTVVVGPAEMADINPSSKNGWTIRDSNVSLFITITLAHVKRAVCKDPTKCVVAQALMDYFHGMVSGFIVGSNITKLINIDSKICTRYTTSGALAKALVNFDKTKLWNLPPGVYELKPLSKSYRRPPRWKEMKHSGGVQSVFKAKASVRSRHALTVCQIMKKAA